MMFDHDDDDDHEKKEKDRKKLFLRFKLQLNEE